MSFHTLCVIALSSLLVPFISADEMPGGGPFILEGVKISPIVRIKKDGKTHDIKSNSFHGDLRFDILGVGKFADQQKDAPFHIVNPPERDKTEITINKPILFAGKKLPAGTNLCQLKRKNSVLPAISTPKPNPLAVHSVRITQKNGFHIPNGKYTITFKWVCLDGKEIVSTQAIEVKKLRSSQ